MISRAAIRCKNLKRLARCYSEGVGQNQSSSTGSSARSPSSDVKSDVPGLSSAVIHPASQPVGPGVDPAKSGAYKVPEYFCYDNMSFYEAEIEMAKYRLPQPSTLNKQM